MLLLGALLIRSWPTLSGSAFFAEDSLLFSQYYGGGQPLGDVVENHFGQPYTTLLSNFFAWLYAYADVRIQPYLYQWTGFIWGMTAACCLFFSGLIKTRAVLLLGPALMGLTAMNHIYYYNTLIYVMYTAVIILLSAMFYPDQRNKVLAILLLLLMIILPWAGPYSVLSIPVVLAMVVLFWKWRRKWMLLLGAPVSTMFYFFTVQGNTAQLAHLKKWGAIKNYFQVLLENIVLMDQVGHVSSWFWLPVLLLITASFYLFRRDRSYIRNSMIMFGIIIASLALFFLSIKFPLYLFTSSCHRVISLYFWCFFLLYTADRFFLKFGWSKVGGVLFSLVVVLLIYVDNTQHPRKRGVEGIPDTGEFLAAVKEVEQLKLAGTSTFVVLKLDNYQKPFFIPTAIVGSRDEDAKQLLPEQLPPEYRSRFVSREPI